MVQVSWHMQAMATVEETVLDNGLRIVVFPFREWPIAATLATYRAGSLHEPNGCAGIAHLMEHMMFRGTERYPGGVIDALTASLGGFNNAVTTTDYAAYYFALPGSGWKTALAIEADRMANCRIDPEVLEIERRIALEERRMAADDPESMLDEALDALMFADHAYARPVMGVLEDISRLTADDLEEFHRERYVPENVSMVVVGGVNASDVFAECAELFGDIRRGPGRAASVSAASGNRPVSPAGPRRERITADRSTPRIALAFATPDAVHEHSPALELLVSLLASGRSSRLYERLVRNDRLATEVGCSRLLQREPGIFTLSAALHPGGRAEQVEDAMLDVLADLADHAVSGGELEKARRLARADLAAAHDTALGAAATLGLWEAIDTWRSGLAFEDRLERVDAGELRQVAELYLGSDVMTSMVLEPGMVDAAPDREVGP